MKNVDVPMWDKGDDTDSFSKGGSSSTFNFSSSNEKSPLIKEIYQLVLGREPSSRESAYYKFSAFKRNEIVQKLLENDEHKNIIEKAKKLPEYKARNKELESNVLKLKTLLEDKESEFLELKRLLVEKNNALDSLRVNKDIPFLTDRKILENNNIHYSTRENMNDTTNKHENFLDKLLQLFFKRDR